MVALEMERVCVRMLLLTAVVLRHNNKCVALRGS